MCIDPVSLRRFRAVLRHMCVGLLDAALQLRLVSSSLEADSLMLGSVQQVYYKEPAWPFRRRRVRRLLEALAVRPPNVVHGLCKRSFELADVIARHFDVHLVLHVVSPEDAEALRRSGGLQPGQVIAASQPLLETIVAGETIEASRVTLARPGVISGEGPTCFTKPGRVPTILCTNQLNPGSGVGRLLEALRLLRRRGYEFMVFLTGSGPMESGLRRTVQSYGLASVVTFAEPLGEATQIMAGADIFIRPSVERMLSVRTLQAMSSGMAVITVRGGAADAYLHKVTGLVCPDGMPTTLAAALERLLDDHAFARALATGAVQHIKKQHSVSAMCDALIQVYQELLLQDKTLPVQE